MQLDVVKVKYAKIAKRPKCSKTVPRFMPNSEVGFIAVLLTANFLVTRFVAVV